MVTGCRRMSWITTAVNRPGDNPDSNDVDYVTVSTDFSVPRVNISADSPFRDRIVGPVVGWPCGCRDSHPWSVGNGLLSRVALQLTVGGY